ncbi:MAG: pyruvate kinase [Patescibacteria group bacterium]|jgi:pyruvate kinase
MKRTKIVCTIGPASEKKEVLIRMIKAGMDVARLNFSHGDYAEHRTLINNIRNAAKKLGRPVAIMQDLQGPRIRVGNVAKEGIDLSRHDKVVLLYEKKIGQSCLVDKNLKILPIQFKELYCYAKKGSHVLINDGLIDIHVNKIYKEGIYGTVTKPGIVFSHKGINIPHAKIETSALTEKDKKDLAFGLKQDIDFVALSFVNTADNIKTLKKFIKKAPVEIIAKIETNEGVKNFGSILKEAHGIMVARGDLGIELPPDKVPLIQKDMIRACLKAAKPVIVATQMLDSMILNPRPTRAEVSDVANAVIDHTDAVMLSGESAFGKYPVETVSMMAEIIKETERSPYDNVSSHFLTQKKYEMSESISANVFDLANENKVKAIVIDSISGHSAKLISRFRPETNIIVLTSHRKTLRQLALTWGAYAHLMPRCHTLDELLKKSVVMVKKEKLVKKGDKIIIVTGHPVGYALGMNLIKVQEIS